MQDKNGLSATRPKAISFRMLPSVNGVMLVACTNLLGVWILDNPGVNTHVDYILSLYRQKIFLRKVSPTKN